jgi:hypothetical protein
MNKPLILLALLATSLHAADPATAAKSLGGEFHSVSGAIVVKKNKTLDVSALVEFAASTLIKYIILDGCTLKSDSVAALAKSKTLTALKLEHTMVNKVPDLKALAGADAGG